MRSHLHQVAILVQYDKLDCFGQLEKNGLAFYPGPVLPPRTDGSSLGNAIFLILDPNLAKMHFDIWQIKNTVAAITRGGMSLGSGSKARAQNSID